MKQLIQSGHTLLLEGREARFGKDLLKRKKFVYMNLQERKKEKEKNYHKNGRKIHARKTKRTIIIITLINDNINPATAIPFPVGLVRPIIPVINAISSNIGETILIKGINCNTKPIIPVTKEVTAAPLLDGCGG